MSDHLLSSENSLRKNVITTNKNGRENALIQELFQFNPDNFLFDKCAFTLRIAINDIPASSLQKIFKGEGRYKLRRIGGIKIKCRLNAYGTLIVTHYFKINFNRIARASICKRYDIQRHGSIVANDSNFVPAKYLQCLFNDGKDFEKLREITYKRFWRTVERKKEIIASFIFEKTGKEINPDHIEILIDHFSVNNDVMTNHGQELVKLQSTWKKLNKIAHDVKIENYIDDFGNKVIPLKSITKDSEKNNLVLKGYEDKTNIEFAFYTKEISKLGILNRLEARFQTKPEIRKALGTTRLRSYEDLVELFETAGLWQSKLLCNTINTPVDHSEEKLNKQLKKYCKLYFKREPLSVYRSLTENQQSICTSCKSSTPNYVKRIVTKLASEGILFRKKCRSLYAVDWDWLKKGGITVVEE